MKPLDAIDKEMCKKVQDLVYTDRRIEVEEIAQPFGISHGSVSAILHECVGMRKLTAFVKRCRSKDEFLLRLLTVDESWAHYYEPQNKAQSHQ